MLCREVKELLSSYLDGALDSDVRESIRAHLKACSICRADFHSLTRVLDVLRLLPAVQPPANFCEAVLHKVSQSKTAEVFPASKKAKRLSFFSNLAVGPWFRKASVAAALCLVVGVTALFYGAPSLWGTKSLLQKVFFDETPAASDGDQLSIVSSSTPETGRPLQESKGSETEPKTIPVLDGSSPGRTGGPERQAPAASGTALTASGNWNEAAGGRSLGFQKTISREFAISRQAVFGSIPVSQEGRQKVVQSATLSVAADPAEFSARVAGIAESYGGSLLPGEAGDEMLTVRVAASRFNQVIISLRELGPVNLRKVIRDDVTEEYLNIELKIKDLSAEEQKLVTASNFAATAAERSAAEARLAAVRQSLDQAKKVFDSLAGEVEFSTIKIEWE